MAKNKVEIDVIVDDKGTTKKVGLGAKKAAEGLDQLGAGSTKAERGIRGVNETASSSGKNFANMSRGMGGLVGAYASFAAQMFAVTAAFGYLKRAGDLSVLQQGQAAYTAATGVAMRTLANDITAATDAQITFRDASEAAAIGIASGLSPEQLTRLGTAAKDASAILGRDVTDSFNRLVRGVTKAEPELLDELGIILRLETANENYARSLGIATTDLTQFQKSQAVANEVLTQSETKYTAVLAAVEKAGFGTTANEFNKLGKSMDDLSMKIQKALLPAANAFATTLIKSPLLAMGSFGLLLKGPLAAMGVSLTAFNELAVKAKVEQKALYDTIQAGAVKARLAVEKLKEKQMQRVENVAADATSGSKTLQNIQGKAYGDISSRDKKQIDKSLKELEGKYKAHEVITKGIFKGLKMSIVTDMTQGFAQIAIAEDALVAADTTATTKMKLNWLSLKATVSAVAASTALWAGRLLSIAGWIGVVVTVIGVLYELLKKEVPKTQAEIALERQAERIKSLTEDYVQLTIVQQALYDSMKDENGNTSDTGATWMAALGNQINSTGVADNNRILEQAASYGKKAKVSGLDALNADVKSAQAAVDAMAQDKASTIDQRNKLERLLESAQRALKNAEEGYSADQRVSSENAISKETYGGVKSNQLFKGAENEAVTEEEKGSNKYLKDSKERIDAFIQATGSQNKAFLDYQAALQTILEGGKVDPKTFNKMQQDAAEMGMTVGQLGAIANDSSTAINSFFLDLAPLNAAESAMEKIGVEMATLTKINNAEGTTSKLKAENTARIELLKEEQTLIKSINDAEHTAAKAKLENAEKSAVISRMANSVLKETAMADMKVVEAKQEQTNLAQEQTNLLAVIKRQTDERVAKGRQITTEEIAAYDNATAAQKKDKEILQLKIDAQKTLVTYLEKEAALTLELEKVNLEIFNIKNDQKMLQMDQTVLENMSKKVSMQQQMNTLVKAENDLKIQQALRAQRKSNPFAFLDQGKEEAAMNLQVAQDSKGADEDAVRAEEALKIKQNVVEYDLLEMKYTLHGLEMEKLRIEQEGVANKLRGEAALEKDPVKKGKLEAQAKVADGLADRAGKFQKTLTTMLGELTGMEADAKKLIQDAAKGKLAAITENISKLEEAKDKVSDIGVLQDGIATSMQSNMESAFMSIVDGTQSAGQAFKGMAASILKDIAAMIVKMMIFRALSAMFPGFAAFQPAVAATATATGRDGGVFSAGKKVPGYAAGGVARGSTSGYPAVLHGTEAVVPLPHGGKIPVEMKGNGGSTNNIVVNVSNDGKTSTSGSTGPDMDKMGAAIAKAVQVELQNQKRSGGILNPYGVS